MVRTRSLEHLSRQALAGAALAALLAWAPFGMVAHAPAYADGSVAQETAEEVTFDEVAPDEGTALTGEGYAPLAYEGTASTGEDSSLPADEDASAASENGALLADENTPSATESDLLVSADNALATDAGGIALPEAATLSDLDIALASGDPVAQVQALGIVTDPSQVEGYDPAADEAPADSGELAISDDESISAQSDSSVRVGDWSYHESKDGSGATVYVIDGYYGSAASVTLPATLGGKQMYSVLFGSSGLPETVTSVTIPASIKEIGASAFSGTNVASVTFAANSLLTSIGYQAFAQTPLTEFILPAHVKTLGYQAFYQSYITRLTLNTELEPMVRTSTIKSGDNAFEVTEHYNPCCGYDNVTFVVPSGSKNYRVENGALLSKDGIILYAQLSDLGGGTYTVPSSVKIIGSYAMCNNTTFSKIVLPQGLTTMEQYCLYGTRITSLDMPDSVTHVQGYICEYCTRLTSVRIGNGLEELGEKAGRECFFGCSSLTSVTLGSKVRVIGNECFRMTKLTSVNLPASLMQINYGAFDNIPTLTSVTGGSGLRYIYKYAFRNTGITSFPLGKNLRFVSNEAFENCKFTPKYPSYMNEESDGYYVYDGTLALSADKGYGLAWQVLGLVNQERAKEGLSALTMDADLLDAAMLRATEAAVCFSHTRPTGWTCFTACSKMVAENLAYGPSTAQEVMTAWMDSDGHRANILRPGLKSIGIGCVKVNGWYCWAQCFGTVEATTVSKPADVSNALTKVYYTADGLASCGKSFVIFPVSSDGSQLESFTTSTLLQGTSQRYALCVQCPTFILRFEDPCVTWSISGTGAKLDASKATVTVTGDGFYTLTASVDGTVRQTLTRKTRATVQGAPTSFKDVASGEWYASWVTQAAQVGLMTGMKDARGSYTGYFEPERGITRAEVATVLWRIAGSPSAKACPLPDVPGHWAQAAVSWCYAKGVVTGYTDGPYKGRFMPDAQVSRQELAVMVWRFAKWASVDTANPSKAAFNYCSDASLVPDWSRDAMIWCASAGIITGIQGNGRPTLSPEAGATRAMAAKIFVKTLWRYDYATSPQSDDAGDEATWEDIDQVTFDDVQTDAVEDSAKTTGSATDTDVAFDAVEPGESGTTGEVTDGLGSKPEQADQTDSATGEPDQAGEAASEPGQIGDAPDSEDPDNSEAPAASEPDAPADTFANPTETGEAPATDATDGPADLAVGTEPSSFDAIAA